MREKRGKYWYRIEIDELRPPFESGDRYVAAVREVFRESPAGPAERISVQFGESYGATKGEAAKDVREEVNAWIDKRGDA